MHYINMKSNFGIETVDEFETREDAQKMLMEYRMSDNTNYYYVSSTCTKEWEKKE